MKITVTGQIQHGMAATELLALIHPDVLARIKKTDPHPEIRAYCIAHEGEAQGNMIGFGKKTIEYAKTVINKIHHALRFGTPLFDRHNSDSSHENRTKIGEIVGKTLKDMGGKLYEIAVTYILPEFKNKPLDIASFEAEVEFNRTATDSLEAVDVREITGVALSSSTVDTPGFPGATLLAAVQAFVGEEEKKPMTREEVLAEFNKLGLTPQDAFSVDALLAVPSVQDKIELTGREAARRKGNEVQEKAEKSLKDMEAELAKVQKELNDAKRRALNAESSQTFEKLMAERKVSDSQRKLIEMRRETFQTSATDAEQRDKDVAAFVENIIKEDEALKSIYGGNQKPENKSEDNPPADKSKDIDAELGF